MQLVALSQFVCLILLPVLSIRYVKSSYIWETNKAEVEIKDTSNHGTIEGSYAGYTSTSSESSTVQGDLLFLDDAFGCPGWNGSVPRPSNLADHVVFLRRTQACDDYKQALLVERAEGLVFFYTSVGGIKFLSAGNNKLDTTVVIIELKEDYVEELKGLPEANTPMVIIRSSTKPVEPSQTFYFVVFAFCILMALSCLWFVLSYLRKCCRNARTRQRPAQSNSAAQKLINTLPVRAHKITKGSSDEEQTCAVCLELFCNKDVIRMLPCKHEFHRKCIDPWLKIKKTCPICKQSIDADRQKRDQVSPESNTTEESQLNEDVESGRRETALVEMVVLDPPANNELQPQPTVTNTVAFA